MRFQEERGNRPPLSQTADDLIKAFESEAERQLLEITGDIKEELRGAVSAALNLESERYTEMKKLLVQYVCDDIRLGKFAPNIFEGEERVWRMYPLILKSMSKKLRGIFDDLMGLPIPERPKPVLRMATGGSGVKT